MFIVYAISTLMFRIMHYHHILMASKGNNCKSSQNECKNIQQRIGRYTANASSLLEFILAIGG